MDDFNKINKPGGGALPKPTLKSDKYLDISGVVSPFSLILWKSTLARMEAGAILEVRLQDRDTLQDLLMILNRSEDQLLGWEQHHEGYYLWVRRCPEGPQSGKHNSLRK